MAHHARRVEHLGDAQAIASWTGAHRRVEREQARLEFRQRVVADWAGIARGQQLFGRLRIVHVCQDHKSIAQPQSGFERFGQALLDVVARTETVDHHFDGVLLAQGQRRYGVEVVDRAVDTGAHETLRAQLVEHLHMLALALADHRRQQHEALLGIERQCRIDHLAHRLRFQRNAMVGTTRRTHARVEQAQVVVHLGNRAHGGARVVRGGLLFDRNRRRQTFDVVHVRLFHHRQKLPGVSRERFDIPALAFRVDGVERQRRFAGAGQAGDHDQPVAGQVKVDVFQVMRARAAYADGVHDARGLGKSVLYQTNQVSYCPPVSSPPRARRPSSSGRAGPTMA